MTATENTTDREHEETDTLVCALCGHKQTGTINELIDAGWFPEFWVDEKTSDGPACPACVESRLETDDQDGEVVLKVSTPSAQQSPADRPSADRIEELQAESDRIAERMDVFNRTGRYPPEA